MGYTLDQLRSMGATPGPAATASAQKKKFTYDELVQQGAVPGSAPVAPAKSPLIFTGGAAPGPKEAPRDDEIMGGFLGNLLTGSTQRFGKTIGNALAAPENAEKYANVLSQHSEIQNNLAKNIAKAKSKGQDTARMEAALARHIADTPKLEQFTGDVINKTAGQVVGEGIGTGLEALSGGVFSTGKNIVASKALTTAQKARQGAQVGGTYGAIQGGAGAMQEGGGIEETVGGALTGGATGAAVGATVPVLAAGLKKTGLFTSAAEKESKQFAKNMVDAEKSIYPTTTKTEKATGALRDESTIFGKKSVVDLQRTPQTRSVIEAVASLPDEIKLKPSDTVAVKTSKLKEGISKLHEGIASQLAEPQIKIQTTYTPSSFRKFMKETILDPLESEFGKDSKEYVEAMKGLKVAEKSIREKNAFGVHTGRQAFDMAFEKANPRAFKSKGGLFGQLDPNVNMKIETGRDIRNAMNSFAESLLPENHPLQPLRRKEATLIRALDEMRGRSTTLLNKNTVQRAINRSPVVKKTLGAVVRSIPFVGGTQIFK